ncbi:UNVERIFIED_CONTAM: hypothetical protein NCL1_47510 [Trichonephila clavipes]
MLRYSIKYAKLSSLRIEYKCSLPYHSSLKCSNISSKECKSCSTAKKLVREFDLRVSRAHIPEGPNLYIQSGSTINLTCIITESTSPPVFVFWYHDDRMINYDSSRGGIKVTTENGPTTVSRLRIQNARPTDSGNYSCQPSYADPANITVHVLNGKHN